MSSYPFMPLARVMDYVPEMEAQGVSSVARSKRGFLTAYRRAGVAGNLSDFWRNKRNGFIARHLVQYRANPTHRRKLALIAWAYNP